MILVKTETEQVTVHTEEIKRNRKAGGGVVSIITETVEIYKELHFSRGGDYTTIHHCCLGINRRGYLLSTSFLDQCFNYYLWVTISCLVSCPSGSGKSSFCIRFLQNLDALCSERNFEGGVIWCYSEKTAVPNQQLAYWRRRFVITRLFHQILKTRMADRASLSSKIYYTTAIPKKCVTCLRKLPITDISPWF